MRKTVFRNFWDSFRHLAYRARDAIALLGANNAVIRFLAISRRLAVNFRGYRRVDSRSTSFGEISIFLGRAVRFSKIRSIRSSAARAPIWQVP